VLPPLVFLIHSSCLISGAVEWEFVSISLLLKIMLNHRVVVVCVALRVEFNLIGAGKIISVIDHRYSSKNKQQQQLEAQLQLNTNK
jgi:hypothetical protein